MIILDGTIKILSIDWDYFCSLRSIKQEYAMPDGGNEYLKPLIQDVVWSQGYANEDAKLQSLEINSEAVKNISAILDNQKSKFTKFFICSSHKELYYQISKMFDKETPMVIYNIDEHHDWYNLGKEVNCGNWVNHVFEEFNLTKYVWYKSVNSDKNATKKHCTIDTNIVSIKHDDTFKDIKNELFDLVFICKSEMWSLPHFDIYFKNLFKKYFKYGEPDIFENRMSRMAPTIEQLKKQFEEMKKYNEELKKNRKEIRKDGKQIVEISRSQQR